MPYFLPDDWTEGIEDSEPAPRSRPYLAAAGRLVRMKGFQRLIPLMRLLPEVDLRIAGTGPFEARLRDLAAGMPNVKFEGLLGGSELARLFHGARAVVVPSLFPETFGYVVLEAFAVRTPVIVHNSGGAIHETGVLSGGGLGYKTDGELLLAMRRMVHADDLRDEVRHVPRGRSRRRQERALRRAGSSASRRRFGVDARACRRRGRRVVLGRFNVAALVRGTERPAPRSPALRCARSAAPH